MFKQCDCERCFRNHLHFSLLMSTTEDCICGICQDSLSGDQCELRLRCSHRFHFECLQQAYQWSSRCPMCRDVSVPNFFGIYPSYISLPATPTLIRQLAYIAETEETEDFTSNDILSTPPPSPEQTQRESSQ